MRRIERMAVRQMYPAYITVILLRWLIAGSLALFSAVGLIGWLLR